MEIAFSLLAITLVCTLFYFSKRKKDPALEKPQVLAERQVEFKGLSSEDYKRLNQLHQRSKKIKDNLKKAQKDDKQ